MPASPALRRLLRIREIEEEQSRLALESALGELHRQERALAATSERERRGRRLIEASVSTGELPDRLAGLEEVRLAARRAGLLAPRIEEAAGGVAELQQEFLGKRVERRQAETLIREIEARDAVEAARHSQQSIDDWFRSRKYREAAEAGHGSTKTADGESAGTEGRT